MILSEELLLAIQQNLSRVVKYNETYQELYDHVISALEAKDSIPDLQKAYTKIMEDDFGGSVGVLNMEKGRVKAVKQDIQKMYVSRLIQFFKLPGILFSALLVVIAYCNIKIFAFGETLLGAIVAIIFVTCLFLPWCFLTYPLSFRAWFFQPFLLLFPNTLP